MAAATLTRESFHGWDSLVMSTAHVRARVLLGKGGDIHELVYVPRGIDVLWKTPWGLRPPSGGPTAPADSQAAWLELYGGGWQVLLPNGGDAGTVAGAPYPFHGEAAVRPWQYEGGEATETGVTVRMRFEGFVSPLRLTRTITLLAERPHLLITERIENLSDVMLPYIWVHHPGFGGPFVDGATRIDTGARRFVADTRVDGDWVPLAPGSAGNWPVIADRAGQPFDLRRAPSATERRAMLGFLHGFSEGGWCALTSPTHGFGVGLTWPTEAFPTAWWWQEAHATPAFPWYRRAYVVAIEPANCAPNHGLASLIAAGQAPPTLAGGASQEATIRVVFYEHALGVAHITPEGVVTASA